MGLWLYLHFLSKVNDILCHPDFDSVRDDMVVHAPCVQFSISVHFNANSSLEFFDLLIVLAVLKFLLHFSIHLVNSQ